MTKYLIKETESWLTGRKAFHAYSLFLGIPFYVHGTGALCAEDCERNLRNVLERAKEKSVEKIVEIE